MKFGKHSKYKLEGIYWRHRKIQLGFFPTNISYKKAVGCKYH